MAKVIQKSGFERLMGNSSVSKPSKAMTQVRSQRIAEEVCRNHGNPQRPMSGHYAG